MNALANKFNPDRFYPLKVWATSVIAIGPILLFVTSAIDDPAYFKNPGNYFIPFLFIGFGLVFSLPTLLVCYITFMILSRRLHSPTLIKVIFIAVCIVGVFVTFLLIGGSEAAVYSLFYSASAVISSLIFTVYNG